MKNNTLRNDNAVNANAIEFFQSSYADGIRDLVLDVTEFGTNADGISQVDPAYCSEFVDRAGIDTITDDIVAELEVLKSCADTTDPIADFIGYCIEVANNIDAIGSRAELNSVDIGDTTTDVVDLADEVIERAELNAQPIADDIELDFELVCIDDEVTIFEKN